MVVSAKGHVIRIYCNTQISCEDLRKVVEDVVGFGDGEFLTDLSLTLVNSLKTLTSEHVNLLCRKICLK